MITGHTNYKKITISLPEALYHRVRKLAGPGRVSQFIVEAIDCKISSNLKPTINPWTAALNAHKFVTKTNPISIKEAINKGRL